MADPAPRVSLEVLQKLDRYPEAQLVHALAIQQAIGRGLLVLCEPPWR